MDVCDLITPSHRYGDRTESCSISHDKLPGLKQHLYKGKSVTSTAQFLTVILVVIAFLSYLESTSFARVDVNSCDAAVNGLLANQIFPQICMDYVL